MNLNSGAEILSVMEIRPLLETTFLFSLQKCLGAIFFISCDLNMSQVGRVVKESMPSNQANAG